MISPVCMEMSFSLFGQICQAATRTFGWGSLRSKCDSENVGERKSCREAMWRKFEETKSMYNMRIIILVSTHLLICHFLFLCESIIIYWLLSTSLTCPSRTVHSPLFAHNVLS